MNLDELDKAITVEKQGRLDELVCPGYGSTRLRRASHLGLKPSKMSRLRRRFQQELNSL